MLATEHRESVLRYVAECEQENDKKDSTKTELFGNAIFEDKSLSPLTQRVDVSPKKLFSPFRQSGSSDTLNSATAATLDSIKSRLYKKQQQQGSDLASRRPNPPFTSFQEECLHLREENVLLRKQTQQLRSLLHRFMEE